MQLLFWLLFRPRAWRNYLKRIDSVPDRNSNRTTCLHWRNPALWRFLLQGYLVLPLLVHLTVALVLWVLHGSVKDISFFLVLSVGWGVMLGMVLGMTFGVAFGMVLGMTFGVAFGVLWNVAFGVLWNVPFGVLWNVPFGFVWGAASGAASGLVWSVVSSATLGSMMLCITVGVVAGVMSGLVFSVAWGVTSGVALGLEWSLVLELAWRQAWDLPSGIVSGVALLIGSGVGATINLWLPVVLYPFFLVWNSLIYILDKRHTGTKPSLLRLHSAFWDELQRLPLISLDKHVVLVAERNPVEGIAAIKYLVGSRHIWAKKAGQQGLQALQIELDARRLERCTNLDAIRNAHYKQVITELESPASPLLHIFNRISEDVKAALNQESTYNQRLALSSVVDRLDGLSRELIRSKDKYAVRFYKIALCWRQEIANGVQQLAKVVELRQEIDSPYIIGVPLTQQQKIFTGRNDIGTRIEELLLDRRRPPLLLYGQRRMGKTSLLYNLGRLLPNSIIPMFVDLQGTPSSANDYAGFLYNIARDMAKSARQQSALTLPSLTREALATDPFTCFDEWLDKVEQALEQNTALLALDEFEVLDSAIAKGRFDEQDVLGMLRNLIQHRPKFKVLIAGSHTIEEYQRWASYLINVQVVHISYLKEDEARQLIERPVKDFTLRYEPDAVERVLQLTRRHPFLVQLLCGEIVALKNEQHFSVRRLATTANVEAAVPEALSSGSLFFADIQNNQVDAAGLAILRFLAAQGEGAIVSRSTMLQQLPDVSESAFELLLQRELIEEVDEGYRFQVELIRRWFAQ
ncbi:nSTAND1 domain-containing NTPase [Scytonema sp. HK-05]|uniref:nSTAND1 domain-containing NTPase n=1 Tax=Scytonema sp. HK-05 TaxID=1137095 RepID=UPI0018EA13AD|nr:ATP-binding protein [Scytonema sp. HK-05]